MARVVQLRFDVILEDNEKSSEYLVKINDFIEKTLNRECMEVDAADMSE